MGRLRYSVRKKIGFNIANQGGNARSEKINITPGKIIEINTNNNTFIVRNKFNEETIHTVSNQGKLVKFRIKTSSNAKKTFYDILSDLEYKEDIYKIE